VLAYDVEIVEQPIAGWPDIDVIVGRRESVVCCLEYASRFLEPGEKTCARESLLPRGQSLGGGHLSRAFGELLRSEQLTTDGPHGWVPGTISGAREEGGEEGRFCSGRYSGCHAYDEQVKVRTRLADGYARTVVLGIG
jgi:hypothetical protein